MTIHPFPKSVAGHAMSASLQDEALPVCDGSLAGVVHAIEPSGRAEAIPASFPRFNLTGYCNQHMGHCRVFIAEVRRDLSDRNNLINLADAVLTGAILAERATENLLRRANHLLANSVCDVSNDRSITWNNPVGKTAEIFGANLGRGK
jgi:hypothetical protein